MNLYAPVRHVIDEFATHSDCSKLEESSILHLRNAWECVTDAAGFASCPDMAVVARGMVPLYLGQAASEVVCGLLVDKLVKSPSSAFEAAYAQISAGKGHERHSGGHPLDQQATPRICRGLGFPMGMGFPMGQALKKIDESLRLESDAKRKELLGAIANLALGTLMYESVRFEESEFSTDRSFPDS